MWVLRKKVDRQKTDGRVIYSVPRTFTRMPHPSHTEEQTCFHATPLGWRLTFTLSPSRLLRWNDVETRLRIAPGDFLESRVN